MNVSIIKQRYSNMNSQNNNIDEFGRDLSLKPKTPPANSVFDEYFARFKGMSWVEIDEIAEEEEQEEIEKSDRVEFLKVLAERKNLLQKGLYELEEGEEVDL